MGVSSFVIGVSVDAMSWESMKFWRLSIVHISQRWAKSEFDLISWLYFSVDTNIKHFTWVQLLQRPHDMALLFVVMFFRTICMEIWVCRCMFLDRCFHNSIGPGCCLWGLLGSKLEFVWNYINVFDVSQRWINGFSSVLSTRYCEGAVLNTVVLCIVSHVWHLVWVARLVSWGLGSVRDA